MKVRTRRQHYGSQGQKWEGDEYEINEVDAKTLIDMGVVEEVEAKENGGGGSKPLTDHSVEELEQIVKDDEVALPEKGSGKDGAIIKQDLVKAIEKHRAR